MTDGQKQQIIRLRKKGCGYTAVASQRPRCKQQGIKFVALQSSGVFDPRGSRQMCMQACPLGSMLAGVKPAFQKTQSRSGSVSKAVM